MGSNNSSLDPELHREFKKAKDEIKKKYLEKKRIMEDNEKKKKSSEDEKKREKDKKKEDWLKEKKEVYYRNLKKESRKLIRFIRGHIEHMIDVMDKQENDSKDAENQGFFNFYLYKEGMHYREEFIQDGYSCSVYYGNSNLSYWPPRLSGKHNTYNLTIDDTIKLIKDTFVNVEVKDVKERHGKKYGYIYDLEWESDPVNYKMVTIKVM